jgi:hypothetical protein
VPTDGRILDIIASALQTAAIDDPRMDSGEMRPAVRLNNEESRHLANAAVNAIEAAGFIIVPREGAYAPRP